MLGSVNTYVLRFCLNVDVVVSECKYVCIEVLFEGVSVRECKYVCIKVLFISTCGC